MTEPGYARRLGLFSATMLVIGGIIGAGIFLSPAVVAQRVGTPALTLGVWGIGAAIFLRSEVRRGGEGWRWGVAADC